MKIIRSAVVLAGLLLSLGVHAQSASAKSAFQSLDFLKGTWEARSNGTSGVNAKSHYSFALELRDHVMARHTASVESCKGPDGYDCGHGDLLYIYPEEAGLRAIYFDNEGHVIHYNVSTPAATTAVFLSDDAAPGPQYRLTYVRKDEVLSGKFELRMPKQTEWKTFLEWRGARK